MITVRCNPASLGARLRAKAQRDRGALGRASTAAAYRYMRYLQQESDRRGVTYMGQWKRGWRVVKTDRGALLHNDCPYAGVIEAGARPHAVSQAGRDAIARWAARKLGLDRPEAVAAAGGIAAKIAQVGQAPTWIVRDSLGVARRFFAVEFARAVRGNARGESAVG